MNTSRSDVVDSGQIRSFVVRIELMNEQKDDLNRDLSEIFKEARGVGFDVTVLRKVVALRRMDRDKRIEQQAILDLYLESLGEYVNTPLGQAAISRAGART